MSLEIIAEEKINAKTGVMYEWKTSRGVTAMSFLSEMKAKEWGVTMRAKHGAAWPGHKLVKITTTITEEEVKSEEKSEFQRQREKDWETFHSA